MSDIVLDKPDGSEFDSSAEVPEKVDLLDVIGVNDIDPDSVGDTWQLTPDGKLFVVRADFRAISIADFGEKNSTGAVILDEDDPRSDAVFYVVAAGAVNEIKRISNIDGGFVFSDRNCEIGYDIFGSDRAKGIWSLQSPIVGNQFSASSHSFLMARHDRVFGDHLGAAMGATQAQVEFVAEFEKLTSKSWGDTIGKTITGVMLAEFLDETFAKGRSNQAAHNLLLSFNDDLRRGLLEAALNKLPECDYELFEYYYDALLVLANEVQDELGFDSKQEQAEARVRVEKVRRTFSL